MVLLPKGNNNYQGIGLLEPFWKVLENLMDTRLEVIPLHECLHGFTKGRGTGTATMEAKLTQQLMFIDQEALYATFMDLKKAYNAMDRGAHPQDPARICSGTKHAKAHCLFLCPGNTGL